jgi:NAD(P)-dependent dehydrogenase (short-subunit alcohol dehydrogenase family)
MLGVIPAAQLFDLTGEVALVTGASSGLGERFAEVLAAHGAKVVMGARRKDRLEALAARIGDGAFATSLDVTSRVSIAAAFDTAEKQFGTVTLLVNNAGIANGDPFLKTPPETHEAIQRTNVDGVWHTAQEAARRMIAAEKPGTIINVASMLGYRVENTSLTYAASKAAVLQMTHGMAVELARHNIRVNSIAPGYITSEMTEKYLASDAGKAMLKRIPQRRTGEPSDLDGALLLLASRRASGFMTGSTIVVDGGHMWSFS